MNKNIFKLLLAQFISAFCDNAILFTIITFIMQSAQQNSWYIPALQASFLVSFVVLAPWVGPFADQKPKSQVLIIANVIKALGTACLFFSIEPILAYAVVGIGAAMYSPAKYGILPELVAENQLVKANGLIEGSTIVAIVTGTVFGAQLSEYSISIAFAVIMALYILSAFIAWFIPKQQLKLAHKIGAIKQFVHMTRRLLKTPRARFSTLGVSLFWASAMVLRVIIVAWAPVVLAVTKPSEIAQLTVFVALGIAVGSIVAPRFIPLAYLRRARLAAYLIGVTIIALSFVDVALLSRVTLFLIGICGGLFVVPINAALQEIGHKSIGSGGAVGIQNFFENLAMLVASGLYALAAGNGASPTTSMAVLGVLVIVATLLVSWHLPPDTGNIDELIPANNNNNDGISKE